MAENKSQAQHLTSLDFDISGIVESLRQADEQTQQMGLEIGKNFSKSVQQGANESGSSFINESSIESAKNKVNELNSAYGELVSTVTKFKGNEVIGSKQTFVDSNNVQTVVSLNKNLEQTVTVTEKIRDVAKEMNATWEAYERTQAGAATREQQKQLKDINAAYAEKIKKEEAEAKQIEINSKKEEDWYFKELELQEKEAAEYKKVEKQLDSLIEKQQKFNTLVSKQRTSSTNKNIISQNNELIKNAKYFKTVVQEQGVSIDDAKTQLETYQESARKLGTTYDEVGTKGDSFLKKIADKAQWLGAFYVVNELYQSFGNITEIIKETEDAVVDLQRVLNTNVSQSTMSDELYSIAEQYGRTFDEVAEVSTAFAQAGYDWNDTLELTKGTMLALNTAELDVTQSTQGLISILSQWNLTADDYADVIDKINLTADSFAVNSENIVAALQRASSSAKNANISLEQTIGIITGLAEATGRSGENIGTALNSLIIYTSKSKALETFAQNGSEAMKQVVDDYEKGAASIYDVWVQLSKELQNLTASQQEALFNSQEYQDFANELESQATEFTSQVSEIYGAAGTYRQNYFIALLNDMSTAQEAIEGMAEAEGYSVDENEKYMESLTANFNQLKSVLAELAVQVGEAGALDALKGLVQIGIQLATITKDIGGIIPVLTALAGILITIKQQKISDSVISPIFSSLKNLKDSLIQYVTSIATAKTATEGFKNALFPLKYTLSTTFSSIPSIIGAAVTAFTLLDSAITYYNQKQSETRKETIELNNANLEKTNNIYYLISSYNSLESVQNRSATQEQELRSVNEQIVSLLGNRASALDGLSQGTQDYTDKVNELTKAELENRRVSLESNVQQYGEEMRSSSLNWRTGDESRIYKSQLKTDNQEIQDILDDTLSAFKQYDVGAKEYFYGPLDSSYEALSDWIMAMTSAKNAIGELGSESEEAANIIIDDKAYKNLSKTISGLTEDFNNYLDALVEAKINEELIQNGIPETADEFENFKEKVFESTGANEDFRDTIYDLVDEAFPSLSEAASDVADNVDDSLSGVFSISSDEMKAFDKELKSLNDTINDAQSGIDAIVSAQQEYAENGYISVDTLQDLISAGSEYVSVLDFTSNGLSINKDRLNELLDAEKGNIDALAAHAYASDVLRISEEYLGETFDNTAGQASNAQVKIDSLNPALATLIENAWNAGDSSFHLAEGLAKVAGVSTKGVDMNAYTKELDDARTRWKNFGAEINKSLSNVNSWSKTGAKNASAAGKSAENQQKKALENQKKAIQEKEKAEKEALEEQKELVKERYDAEIDSLKKVQEEEDRLEKQREYYKNRQDALDEISQAASRSGIEYREQEAEAQEKLAELDQDWRDQLEDWSVEDKIDQLESLRDAEVEAIEDQIDSIEEMYDAQLDAIEKQIEAVSDSISSAGSGLSSGLSNSYNNNFLVPTEKNTNSMIERLFDTTDKSASEINNRLINYALNTSQDMYKYFQTNFFLPMTDDFSKISVALSASLSPLIPSQSVLSKIPLSNEAYNKLTQNYNTSNTNNNIYANVYGQSFSNPLQKSIFTKK